MAQVTIVASQVLDIIVLRGLWKGAQARELVESCWARRSVEREQLEEGVLRLAGAGVSPGRRWNGRRAQADRRFADRVGRGCEGGENPRAGWVQGTSHR